MAPVFGRLAKFYRNRIEFIAVNAYDRPDIAKPFGVKAVPTFILVRRGKALRRFYGNIHEAILKQHLAPYAPAAPVETEEEKDGLLGRLTK
ncbi:MAG TPA: thioredoxin family protein, partial [Dehalococcoidia bacterium]|nr:thioredoxin family protein [Dehalococcoidia bacterium]